jgi:3',5'-cyclic AMP phosphodiesterase CpdA
MTKLIWLTDLHLVAPGRDWPQNVNPLARLAACLEEIREQQADAARIILSGDLVQRPHPDAYRLLRAELERMPMDYRLLVGNHDDRATLLEVFPETPSVNGFIQSTDEFADVQLLFLDTLASDGKHHGELCPVRIRWAAEQIAAADERPLLVFLHHPPFEIGVPALDRLRLLEADGLAAALRARSGPTQLFCGHLHRNVSGLWAGHPFAILKSPHVQFDLDMVGSKLVRSKEPPGYGVILVDRDGIIVNYRDLPAS